MNETLEKLSLKHLDKSEVLELLGNSVGYPTKLVEDLSRLTAINYWNGKIDYTAGNLIMNNLYTMWVNHNEFFRNNRFGDFAMRCYLAFDSGEYLRPKDDPKTDPSEKYTKPLIRELLLDDGII